LMARRRRPAARGAGATLVALALLAAGPAQAQARKGAKPVKVVVIPMTAGLGVQAELAEAMTSVLLAELTGRGIQVVTPKDVETALVIAHQKQMLGCSSEECLTELAGAMGTDLIVSGSLAVVGKVKMTTAQLFNAQTGVVERTFQEHLENAETEDLLEAAERAGESLFPGTRKSGRGPTRRTLLAAAPVRPLALELGGFYEPTGPGALASLLLTWRLDAGVRLSAGVLLAGSMHPGAMLKVSWAPFQRWRFSPYLAVEGLGVFAKETLLGAGAAVGLEWAITERLSLGAEIPAVWLLSAPAEYKTSYLMPGLILGWAL
jgi:hypothetical protein